MPNFNKISRSTAEVKLLLVSENERPPYWNSLSGFDYNVCVVIGMSFYICLPFRSNRSIGGRVMTAYPFFKMAAGSHIGFDLGKMLDHQRSAILDLSLVLKFGLDLVYSFGDIAVSAGNCLFTPIFWGRRLGHTSPKYGH